MYYQNKIVQIYIIEIFKRREYCINMINRHPSGPSFSSPPEKVQRGRNGLSLLSGQGPSETGNGKAAGGHRDDLQDPQGTGQRGRGDRQKTGGRDGGGSEGKDQEAPGEQQGGAGPPHGSFGPQRRAERDGAQERIQGL